MTSVGHHTSWFLLDVAWSSPPPAFRTRAATVAQFFESSFQWALCFLRICSKAAFIASMSSPFRATQRVGSRMSDVGDALAPFQLAPSVRKSPLTPRDPGFDTSAYQLTYHWTWRPGAVRYSENLTESMITDAWPFARASGMTFGLQ